MTTDTSTPFSPATAQAIANAAAAAILPLPQRMIQHRKNLRSIAFHQGIEGVAQYKKEHLEAASIRVDLSAFAYSPKPQGYATYLASLAERWLVSKGAVEASNAADVEQLNVRFGSTFPIGKHFSEPLSSGRLKKIKGVFARHGIPLDIKQANTMSKVRSVARAAKVQLNPERRLGMLGVVTGNTLVINRQPFLIESNGKRDCIRVTIEGKRRRLYLDEMEWLAELLIGDGVDPLSTTTIRSMGELAYSGIEPDFPLRTAAEISETAWNEIPNEPEGSPRLMAPSEPADPLEFVDPLETCSMD